MLNYSAAVQCLSTINQLGSAGRLVTSRVINVSPVTRCALFIDSLVVQDAAATCQYVNTCLFLVPPVIPSLQSFINQCIFIGV